MPSDAIRGIIFDLDGTLVDSGLDFAAMRREMGLFGGDSILDAIERMPANRAADCRAILTAHEQAGVARATLMPGVLEFLGRLRARGMPMAILTRNSRGSALAMLERLNLSLSPVIAREDAPPKPDPTAIWRICDSWGIAPSSAAMIGDYHYDIDAGRNAGARTVLYLGGRSLADIEYAARADFVLDCFSLPEHLLAWLDRPISRR